MTYKKFKNRLDYLNDNINDIDYPESVFNNKIWTDKYLKELYERSVNGARSPKSIERFKKVGHFIFAVKLLIVVIICILIYLVIKNIIMSSNEYDNKTNDVVIQDTVFK